MNSFKSQTSIALYEQYKNYMQQVADIKYAAAVLQWDEETYMPQKGAAIRGRQLATLSETAHRMFTGKDLFELLQVLNERADLSIDQSINVQLSLEDVLRQQKLSPVFVRNMSEAVSQSFHQWVLAKQSNDFHSYAPYLNKVLTLKQEEADIRGFIGHPYNAMLDEYERGSTVAQLDKLFDDLKPLLLSLIPSATSFTNINTDFLNKEYDKEQQWEWGIFLLKELGFDFDAGRQDISAHPFTTNFSAQDVRITTRVDTNDLKNMTWSTLHELGHGLYEQGLPIEEYGLPAGEYCSLSIHESQSRLWENCVGRSWGFVQKYYPVLQQRFSNQLTDIDAEQFYKAINKVQPSLIRTEADELTYHAHIIIRYTIEKELFEKMITVSDIPTRWNELYKHHLDIIVPNDRQGCLQDVHWSHGSFGYFPTYSTGSLYAAQFWYFFQQSPASIKPTSYTHLLEWLREKIHAHGRKYTSENLCKMVTGQSLQTDFFISYIRQKYSKIRQ